MAHKNLESRENRKFEIELNIRTRFDQNRSNLVTAGKWISPLVVSLFVKIAIHYLVLWLHLG